MKKIITKSFLLFALSMTVLTACYSRVKPFKKITIDSSNNASIDNRYYQLSIPTSLKKKDIAALKDYVVNQLDIFKASEFEQQLMVMNWVHHKWEHDGSMSPGQMTALSILQAADQGRKFSCIEYSRVFCEVLHSLGHIGRTLGITSSDIAYGSIGVAHAVAEVWSNEYQKWVYYDPQFNVIAKHKGIPLHFLEISNLKHSGKLKEVEFYFCNSSRPERLNKEQLSIYLQFLERYFSYMMCDMIVDGKTIMYVLPLESTKQFLTSQGGNSKPMIFISDSKELYFDINKTNILFNFNTETPDIASIVADSQLKTKEEFAERMGEFAAVPDFTLHFTTNTPWFSYYEVQLGDKDSWNKIIGNTFRWKLNDGKNVIQVRSVNQAGIKGIITRMNISYQ